MDLNSSGTSDWGSMSGHTSADSLADSLSMHDDRSAGGLIDVVKSEDMGGGFNSEIPAGKRVSELVHILPATGGIIASCVTGRLFKINLGARYFVWCKKLHRCKRNFLLRRL